ncbi:hypothetical protein [Micromonospora sp. DT233]
MEQIVGLAQEVEIENVADEADELEFDRETLSDYLAMVHRC